MPWYLIEFNIGISDKLADYIKTTYGSSGQTIKLFERQGNYTRIIAFAASQAAINNALQDLRTRLVEIQELTSYNPPE